MVKLANNMMFKTKKIKIFIIPIIVFLLGLLVLANFIGTRKDTDTLHKASSMFESGEKEKAIKSVERYLEKYPDDDAKNKLATMYFQSANYDKFIQFVDENKLTSPNIFNMLAASYQVKSESEKSEMYYSKAIASDPANAKLYINFSAYYQSVGKPQQALEVLEKGLESGSKNVALLITAASVSLKLNDTQKAEGFLKEALNIEPKNTQAQTMLSQI